MKNLDWRVISGERGGRPELWGSNSSGVVMAMYRCGRHGGFEGRTGFGERWVRCVAADVAPADKLRELQGVS